MAIKITKDGKWTLNGESTAIGRKGDVNVNKITLVVDRFTGDETDLKDGIAILSITNSEAYLNPVYLTQESYDDSEITYTWLVGAEECATAGTLYVALAVTIADTDGTVTDRFKSLIQSFVIEESNDMPDGSGSVSYDDAVAKAKTQIDAYGSQYEKSADHAADITKLNDDLNDHEERITKLENGGGSGGTANITGLTKTYKNFALNKTICIFGDSLSDPNANGKWIEPFEALITGYKSFKNYGRGFARYTFHDDTVEDTATTTNTNDDNNVIWNQFNRMKKDVDNGNISEPDIILMFAGANDIIQGCTFGDSSTFSTSAQGEITTLTTMTASVRKVCDLINENYPDCVVILATPMPMPFRYAKTVECHDALVVCAENIGIPYIDNTLNSGIAWYREGISQTYFLSDGVHLTDEGGEFVANSMYKKMQMMPELYTDIISNISVSSSSDSGSADSGSTDRTDTESEESGGSSSGTATGSTANHIFDSYDNMASVYASGAIGLAPASTSVYDAYGSTDGTTGSIDTAKVMCATAGKTGLLLVVKQTDSNDIATASAATFELLKVVQYTSVAGETDVDIDYENADGDTIYLLNVGAANCKASSGITSVLPYYGRTIYIKNACNNTIPEVGTTLSASLYDLSSSSSFAIAYMYESDK